MYLNGIAPGIICYFAISLFIVSQLVEKPIMFLVLVQYVRPLAAIDHYIDQHMAFLKKYSDNGQFVISGRRKPRTGGLILVKADSRRAVEAIIAEDPFDRLQLALYEIIEFEPTTVNETLLSFLDK